MSLRQGDNTANTQMDTVNVDTINHYCNLLETTLRENYLLNSSAQIYNVDETGMPIDPKAPNIVTKTGTKKVRYRSTGKKGQITVVACASDAGQVLPPTVLLDEKKVSHASTSVEIPRTSYGCSLAVIKSG